MVHAPARKKSLPANGQLENGVANLEPIPPDGGWGWMVVFGSFMIHVINDGITYSFGELNTQFLNEFHQTKAYTSWITSTLTGITYLSGPISSSFVNRYGCRTVTIAGAILSAVCIAVSYFAQNVATLIVTIGIGTGLGFGMIYLPAIVSVTQYFEAKRSLATGIAVCGSGIGTFVFSGLITYLIEGLGWQGTLLVLGAIVLSCIFFGILFRPLTPTPIDPNAKENELQPLKNNNKVHVLNAESPQRSNSIGHVYEFNTNNNSNEYTNGQETCIKNVLSLGSQDIVRSAVSQPHLAEEQTRAADLKKRFGSGTMYRPDILYQGSLLNIPEYVSSRHDVSGGHNRYGATKKRNAVSESEETIKVCGCVKCSRETQDTFTEMMDFSLLFDKIFFIFTLSNFLTSLGLNIPYIFMDDYVGVLKFEEGSGGRLLGIIGIANTVARIILGYISDKPSINRQMIYNSCLIICGASMICVPWCENFMQVAICCGVFGFTIGAYVGLTSVILVDLLGLDKLTNAFGLLLLFQGIATLIGAPVGGLLTDITGSYKSAFLMSGIMILLSGVVMFAIPLIQRSRGPKDTTTTSAH